MIRWTTFSLQVALLAAACLSAGCASHPDQKAAVYSALTNVNLRSIMVKQDRRTGVITLTGRVTSTTLRSQAETVAQQAAPGYTIDDQIQVKPL